MLLRPVLVRTIREQIVDHLRQEILSGVYAEGSSLREQHLAEKYGVSRGPIRDALLQLTKEGLLSAQPNRGVKVRHRPSDKNRPLLVSLRRQIEAYALRTIFNDIGAADLVHWENNLEAFREACEASNMPAVVQHDMAFHRSIVERAGDEVLLAIWMPIITHLMLPYSRHRSLMESYQEHRSVLEAIKQQDLEVAVERLQANIQ